MAEFKRSRLVRKSEDDVTKKTVVAGVATILLSLSVLIFGLPLLVRFSIFLGDLKTSSDKTNKEVVLPPLPPRLVLPFEATNSAKITITGYAEPGVTVELLKNDVSVGKTQVDTTGSFGFVDINLDMGDNSIGAVAMTDKGGSSEQSKNLTVVFDDVAPELQMTNPAEDSLTVDSPDFDVAGKSEKWVSATINGRMAMVDEDGKFKLKFQLTPGKNDIEVVVKDAAGNEIRKKIAITYNF